MARLQILELPEGGGDDRPPFILVVDQVPRDEPAFDALRRDLNEGDLAQRTGARAVLVFEDTIDIPANDAPTPVDDAFKNDVHNWAAGTNETLVRIIDAIGGRRKRPKSSQTRRPLSEEQAKKLLDITRDA